MDIDERLLEIREALYRLATRAIIIHDHKILMVIDEQWLSLPGGGVDYGETPLVGLERELEEEIGVPRGTATIHPQIIFVTTTTIHNKIPRACLFYSVQVPHPEKIKGHEHEIRWLDKKELQTMQLHPMLKDAREFLAGLL